MGSVLHVVFGADTIVKETCQLKKEENMLCSDGSEVDNTFWSTTSSETAMTCPKVR